VAELYPDRHKEPERAVSSENASPAERPRAENRLLPQPAWSLKRVYARRDPATAAGRCSRCRSLGTCDLCSHRRRGQLW